jgi:hypothetical protein
LLGFHLLPPDASQQCVERWTERRGRSRVTVTLRVVASDRRRRQETIRISLAASSPRGQQRLRDEFPLRLYTATQFRRLLGSVPQWELAATYDFWLELDRPLPLTDELADVVLVLRRQ